MLLDNRYIGLIIVAVIFSLLAWLYLLIYWQSNRYNKKLKRLKKLKLLSQRLTRRKRVR